MHGPTCVAWANLTPCSLQAIAALERAEYEGDLEQALEAEGMSLVLGSLGQAALAVASSALAAGPTLRTQMVALAQGDTATSTESDSRRQQAYCVTP